ncbi:MULTISPECIES: hypothetical protein [Nostoc]|uniref:Uncharacterized protein n=1 Tax=Nostoc paludosum FACHB-159 TaxID=2692908 RepID=A0ABR8KGQ1_9NOSO|nr:MULTISPECIES: hypothetical protein [Nostoc]MBD2681584.1 hypothetical protein [Nostoc sp. FACHB-857]MBD2738044.1 hypothetical protein [Nostoc paludosum FACHB-159]
MEGKRRSRSIASSSSSTKGGHSKGKSPSKKAKHEKGDARRKQDQDVNPKWQEYKKNGGRLAKNAWENQGMPKRD